MTFNAEGLLIGECGQVESTLGDIGTSSWKVPMTCILKPALFSSPN